MKSRLSLWILILSLILHATAPLHADGKMYSEKVNTTIPYQRALIIHHQAQQTLILQSQYHIPGIPGPHQIGWVVPVPAVPEIASMNADEAHQLFATLDRITQPETTSWGFPFILVLTLLLITSTIFTTVASCFAKHPQQRRRLRIIAISSFITLLILTLTSPFFITSSKSSDGIEVIKSARVGIFDTQVIRAESAADLTRWFNQNSFRFNQTDESTIQSYIDQDWCFVTAKVDTSIDLQSRKVLSDHLLAPLILQFPTPDPVYPTALTATGKHPTEILLYLLTDQPVKTNSPLICKFRSPIEENNLPLYVSTTQPTDFFFEHLPTIPSHLSKFKATLTSPQMETDIRFTPDPTAPPYREHNHRW